MSGLLSYFSWDRKRAVEPKEEVKKVEEKQQPVRALPASWYTSPDMYEFERRAVFANRWLFMTTTLRILNAGDYIRYRFAGYDIIIIRNQENEVKAFHNTSKQSQQVLIDNNTKEASGHINLADFSTPADDVFPIHTRIDRNGFIWINLDATATPEIPFDQCFKDVDIQERYAPIDFKNYDLNHVYTLETEYNWKIASDNFNECYHCPTTHPDIPAFLNLDSFDSALKDGHIQHACAPTQEQIDLGVNVHSTYYFPNVSMTVGKHFLMIQKFLPHSPSTSTSHYEVFKAKTSSDEEFHLIADMYERVMREDKVLCNNAQKNLNRGVFKAGYLHPKYEKAPIFFQQNCREVVNEHWKREKREGREVHPAKQPGLTFDGPAQKAEIETGTGMEQGAQKGVLAW
ncbi:putative Rieske 2Fe-2S family protein [Macroventuria anomochaeta]|uniref:Rieske 2Fe-2S family protein n=1 Tax=Macroventuria anomochaeta TaxID=301207 RepID=A0ACB6RJH2_9PLEO|nr:putative Rieske 2Fe-2S family protein [Macroventuria anomochaeta]KAF2622021.1 putative Rieske 2Fe-2S family protein [Macroventuria anomochaeta]